MRAMLALTAMRWPIATNDNFSNSSIDFPGVMKVSHQQGRRPD
jgi:hypothetical protein